MANEKLVKEWLSCWQLYKALAYVRDAIRDDGRDDAFDALRQLERAIIAAKALSKKVLLPERHRLQVDLEAAAFCCDQADMETLCIDDAEKPLFYQGVLRDIRTEAGSFIRHTASAYVWLEQYAVEVEDIEAIVGQSLEVLNTMDWFELLDVLPSDAVERDPVKQKLLEDWISCEDSWKEFAIRHGGIERKAALRQLIMNYSKLTGQSYAKVNK